MGVLLFGFTHRRTLQCVLACVLACAFAACAGIGGCVSHDMGVQFAGVHVVDYYNQRELSLPSAAGMEVLIGREAAENLPEAIVPKGQKRPHRLQLRIEFSSARLWDVAQDGALISVDARFCSHPNDYAVITGGGVYFDGVRILPSQRPHGGDALKGRRTYYFYANVAREASPISGPPQVGFDLTASAEDICFQVEGRGAWGLIYATSVARVPRSDIESALRAAQSLVDSIPAQ